MPGLATAVPTIANGGISQDLKTWTFHLKPGLKWSDGMPLDARDVDVESTADAEHFVPGMVLRHRAVKLPDGVHLEAVTGWALGIYPGGGGGQ